MALSEDNLPPYPQRSDTLLAEGRYSPHGASADSADRPHPRKHMVSFSQIEKDIEPLRYRRGKKEK